MFKSTIQQYILREMKNIQPIGAIFLLAMLSTTSIAGSFSGYESSSESRFVYNLCTRSVDDLKNGGTAFISDGYSHDLGNCLIWARSLNNRMILNYTNCDMLDLATEESCSKIWGFLGKDHKACVNERSNKIGRNPGWVYNFGYCHTACPTVNPPLPNQPPFNLPPCGLHVIPPEI